MCVKSGEIQIFSFCQGGADLIDRFVAAASLALLAAAALAILFREGIRGRRLLLCILPVALAFILRWACMDHMTYDYLDFLSNWAAWFREHGGWSAVKDPVGNYNAPYLYFLAAISYLPVSDLYLIKLFSIAFDVVLAWGGLRVVRIFCPSGSPRPAIAFCLLLLLPTVMLNGAYWSQCDSLYGALCLHALACALNGRPKSSVTLLAVAFSFKLQTIFLLPLWCALWFTGRVKFRHFALFPLSYFLTIFPALLLGKPLADILGVYFGQAAEYSAYLTLNAPSVYALLPYGAQVDTVLASRLGILSAFILVAVLLLLLFRFRRQANTQLLRTAAAILSLGVPLLLPHMHDRYFFLADVITLTAACITPLRWPQAALVQFSSLSAYATYLRLEYTAPLHFGSILLPMGLEALCLLAALAMLWITLIRQIISVKQRPLSP